MGAKAASRRLLYKGTRPSRAAAVLNRATARLASAGFSPERLVTLEVVGRRSGRTIAQPVVVAEHDGDRYLVAMLGARASWPLNVRAAGGRAVLRHRGREVVDLVEVPPHERAPVLKGYLDAAPGARAHFRVDRNAPLSAFEAIAIDYPVFRVEKRSL